MPSKEITLDEWMTENRWTNVSAAEEISRIMTQRAGDDGPKSVTHGQIRMVRHKLRKPSADLAMAIYEFVGKEVSLDSLLS